LIKSAYMNDLNNGTDDTHIQSIWGRQWIDVQKKQIHN
jgi:hypothetical protein